MRIDRLSMNTLRDFYKIVDFKTKLSTPMQLHPIYKEAVQQAKIQNKDFMFPKNSSKIIIDKNTKYQYWMSQLAQFQFDPKVWVCPNWPDAEVGDYSSQANFTTKII